MIQKDLQGNLWECKIYGSRSSGITLQAYHQIIQRQYDGLRDIKEYVEKWKELNIKAEVPTKCQDYILSIVDKALGSDIE